MKKWWIAVVFAAGMAASVLSSAAMAQVDSSRDVAPRSVIRTGTIIRVDDGHGSATGTLVHPFAVMRADTIVLVRCRTCVRENYPGSALRSAEVAVGTSRSTHVAQGIVVGAIAGVSAGALVGRYYIYAGKETSGGNPTIGAVLGGLLGVSVGALVGASLPSSFHWMTLELR